MKMGRLLGKASSRTALGTPRPARPAALWSWETRLVLEGPGGSRRLWAGRCERPGGERRGARPGEMRAGPEREEGGA